MDKRKILFDFFEVVGVFGDKTKGAERMALCKKVRHSALVPPLPFFSFFFLFFFTLQMRARPERKRAGGTSAGYGSFPAVVGKSALSHRNAETPLYEGEKRIGERQSTAGKCDNPQRLVR